MPGVREMVLTSRRPKRIEVGRSRRGNPHVLRNTSLEVTSARMTKGVTLGGGCYQIFPTTTGLWSHDGRIPVLVGSSPADNPTFGRLGDATLTHSGRSRWMFSTPVPDSPETLALERLALDQQSKPFCLLETRDPSAPWGRACVWRLVSKPRVRRHRSIYTASTLLLLRNRQNRLLTARLLGGTRPASVAWRSDHLSSSKSIYRYTNYNRCMIQLWA